MLMSGAFRTISRYWSVISLTKMSRMSICAFPIRVSSRSSGPSKSFSLNSRVIIYTKAPMMLLKNPYTAPFTVVSSPLSTPVMHTIRNPI